MKKFDVIVVGGGPGGSVASTILAQNKLSVALFEREPFPRFHIGESLLPASMPIFKEIGFYDTLNNGKYLKKYGARFIDYETDEEVYFGFADGLNPNIPSAFEVPRAQFDSDILAHAKNSGVEVFQPENIKSIELHPTHVIARTENDEFQADYVIDVSGRDSIIGKHLKIRDSIKDLNNVAVFSHYEGVSRYKVQRPDRHGRHPASIFWPIRDAPRHRHERRLVQGSGAVLRHSIGRRERRSGRAHRTGHRL